MAPTRSSPGFLDLPPELRNQIYSEYFSLHRGQMHVKAELFSPNRRICQSVHEVISPVRTSLDTGGRDVPPSASSTGPITLLMANKSVFNEAFAMFLHSTTFRFTDSTSMYHLMKRHDPEMLQNIRFVVIDQTKGFNPTDLKFMIKMVAFRNRFPRLSRLCVWFASERDGFWSKEIPEIEKTLFEPGLFRGINARAIYIIDPLLRTVLMSKSDLLSTNSAAAGSDDRSQTLSALKLVLLTAEVSLRRIDEQWSIISGSTDGVGQ